MAQWLGYALWLSAWLRRCSRGCLKKHVVRKNIYTIQFSHISFTPNSHPHSSNATQRGLPPCSSPSLSTAALSPRASTGVVEDRSIRPVSAHSGRACKISTACQPHRTTGACSTGLEKDDPSNSQKHAATHVGMRGNVATSSIVKQTTRTTAATSNEDAIRRRPREVPSQPIWNTRRARAGSWSRRCHPRCR